MRRLTVFLIALLVPMPSLAWHESGHRATAQIAFAGMDAGLRGEVARVLAAHPRYNEDFIAWMPQTVAAGDADTRGRWLLAQSSVWPDMAREFPMAERQRYDQGTWHYINEVVWLQDEDRQALDGSLTQNLDRRPAGPATGMNSAQALRANLAVWHDASAADADRAVALCWIVHIAGDMHQPLHNTALFSRSRFPNGDRGGNLVIVARSPDDTNLHAAWDGLVGEDDELQPDADLSRVIAQDVVDDGAIDRWVDAHANLARLFVYDGEVEAQLIEAERVAAPARVTLSDRYLEAGRRVARRQVILAGYRIPKLLGPAYRAAPE